MAGLKSSADKKRQATDELPKRFAMALQNKMIDFPLNHAYNRLTQCGIKKLIEIL
jgi:hypothetical protein